MSAPTNRHLTAPERETVIIFSDADNTATITTHQRRIITKLERNPAARKIDDLTFGSTAGAKFELDASLISFRSVSRKGRTAAPGSFGRTRDDVIEAATPEATDDLPATSKQQFGAQGVA